jgi:hypothetical protein
MQRRLVTGITLIQRRKLSGTCLARPNRNAPPDAGAGDTSWSGIVWNGTGSTSDVSPK